MSSQKNTLLLGTRKGLITFKCKRNRWEFASETFPGIAASYVFKDERNNVLWCGLDHGHWGCKLHRSKDEGKTWEEIDAPKYPEGAEIKDGVPATLRYIWTISCGGDDEPQKLYIGSEPGGLFQSDDGGNSFFLVKELWNHPSRKEHWFGGGRDHAGIHSVIVDPRNYKHVYVGISCAGVFETQDGGKNWSPQNKGLYASFLPDPSVEVGHDPHLIVYSSENPNVLWQQNHCGIYRSVDGAKTWQDISQKDGPANFGFAIATNKKPETAWVVPAVSDEIRVSVDRGLCVCRTDDGGKTWSMLNKGLPQRNCYDIVFRHALDVSGDTVVFATTTGNLYLSENRGDAWSCISNNLPPVYSVRFAG